jgi:glutamine amidotransferase
MPPKVMIAVVDAGLGNLRSVAKSLAAVGGEPIVTSDPDVVARADRVVVPGQGAFRDCMAGLAGGLDEAVRAHIARGRPYLGICLGLQVLFGESEEQGPCAGLGVLPGRVTRLAPGPGAKLPHIGWNQVTPTAALRGPAIASGAHFYFVHSFCAAPADSGAVALTCEYAGASFCAAVQRDNLFATQFHPEKSQRAGLALLEWFVCS